METSIVKVHHAFKTGDLTARQLVQMYLDRIEAYDQSTKLNAFVLVNPNALKIADRLDAEYIGEDGSKHQPVMMHRAILGSFERFIGILIENYSGKLPFWIAPLQSMIIPVSEEFYETFSSLNNSEKKRNESGLANINYILKEVEKNSIIIQSLTKNLQ